MTAADDAGTPEEDFAEPYIEPEDQPGIDGHVARIDARWEERRQAECAGRKYAAELLSESEPVVKAALYQLAMDSPRLYVTSQYGPSAEAIDIENEVSRLRIRQAAKTQFEQEMRQISEESHIRMVEGGSFIHDLPPDLPCLWGLDNQIVWVSGEALTLVGTPGVGKTTLAGQVVRARLIGGEVLGMKVAKTESKVLYLAMDRPQQIGRALARQLRDVPRAVLDARLMVWPGPPVQDLATHPDLMLQMARDADADTVVVDSLKDAAIGLSNDEVGAGYNRARQLCLAHGVEMFELHHMKKQGGSGTGKATKPTKLEDVYGSAWLTAGAGSVVLLVGDAGDPVVEWRHLKQPAEPVGPFVVEHDHSAGSSAVYTGTEAYDIIRRAGRAGITVKEFSLQWLGTGDNSTREGKSAIAKTRRKLHGYVRDGKVRCVDSGDRRTGSPARYVVAAFVDDPADDFSENGDDNLI